MLESRKNRNDGYDRRKALENGALTSVARWGTFDPWKGLYTLPVFTQILKFNNKEKVRAFKARQLNQMKRWRKTGLAYFATVSAG